MKALLAGHISLDYRGGQKLLGGPPLYQIPVLLSYGFEIDVLTSFAEKDLEVIAKYPTVNFIVIKSEYTTTYQFKQNTSNEPIEDDRQLILKFKANEITSKNLNQLKDEYDIVIISPIALEFSNVVIKKLAKLGKFSFFDVQGLVRRFDTKGQMYQELDIEDFNDILKTFDVIKASKSEIQLIKNLRNPYKSQLIVTDNGNKVRVLSKNESYFLEVSKTDVIKDATGSGDIFLAMIASQYTKLPFNECIIQAHEVAKANLTTIGIPSTELILNQLNSYDLSQ